MISDNLLLEINEDTLPLLRQLAEHMACGFIVYRAHANEELLLANSALLRLTGCADMRQLEALTGNSFRGLVHPEDIGRVEQEIADQVRKDTAGHDYAEFRMRRRDGSAAWVRTNGQLVHTRAFGDVFYAFLEDASDRHPAPAPGSTACENAMLPGSMCRRRIVHNESARKTILVVEDSEINRELLEELLADEFRVISAENGEEGIRLLKEHRSRLSLVLLDVYMPVCDGFQFLEQTQRDPFLSSVPVIVATGSDRHEDEEKCLRLGAADFVNKPYNPETMLGRIHNVIRLHESIRELSVVEFDKLTGLYTMASFLHHAAQQLAESEADFDLSILSLPDFSTINRVHGERKGDEVLRYFADLLRRNLPDSLLARTGSDFMVLTVAGQDALVTAAPSFLADLEVNGPVPGLRPRLGLYRQVDKRQPMSVLCDRVKLAVSESKNAAEGAVCYYDASMEQRKLEELRLLNSFDSALANHEFVAWVQPKVAITDGTIVAGEALVRWIDSEGGFISPGAFIPLFEREGQIQQLDEYIFRTICAYQRGRKEAGKRLVPISVNLSRNSLFRKGIVQRYHQIAQEEQADLSLVPLEITESAATSEKQILEICNSFVQAGFVLQMDDFGTGYSSLSALATLPFSVLKLDKSLIDQIGGGKGDIIIKHLIDTAHELGMKVVAEGVEEEPQVRFLSQVDCDQIQGYYYSPPKKLPLFEELMAQDAPFAEKRIVTVVPDDGIIRFSSVELNHCLRICKRIFAAARILEADCCSYHMAHEDGTLGRLRTPCFGIWERSERCANCTSLRAMQQKKTMHKFEVFENEVYSVYSVYLEVEGRPHVLELLSTVGAGTLHGYKDDTSLLSLLQAGRLELYMDVQLGTLNRRFFEERKDSLKNISALAMIDIDDFKEINDRNGHPAGDSALATIAHAIKSVIRDTDFLIRMGGDELMIGFTGMKAPRLRAKLEDIRSAVETVHLEENETIHPTVSIGATVCRGYSEETREKADRALYEAKSAKNTVVIH